MTTIVKLKDPGKKCVQCSGSAIQVCNGCKGALDVEGQVVEEVAYCEAACQKLHFPKHARACNDAKARRCLWRAASTAQLAFYLVRKRLWSTSIEKVETKGQGNLLIREGLHRGANFLPFQEHLFENESDQRAVLSFLTCRTVLVYLHDFINDILRGE